MRISCRSGNTVTLPAGKTALLVIDMQRDFLDPQGMCAVSGDDPALLQAIIPRVQRLVEWARTGKLLLVHTREGYAPDLSDRHPAKGPVVGDVNEGPLGRFLIRGQAGHDFIAELRPAPGEWVIDKPGFSAFYGTDLDARLAAAGITQLILCGVTTNCCVQSTMRDAIDRGYSCLTVADGCAALEPDLHDHALDLIAGEGNLFGEVCDVANLAGPAPSRPLQAITLRAMIDADAEAVLAIYGQGIATGHATYQEEPGDWVSFSSGKLPAPRLVACDTKGVVLGYAVLSPTSSRPVYRGICELSIYVADAAKGLGVGHALMARLIQDCEASGIWTLTAGIFPENKASLILHAAHGFRCLGRTLDAGKMSFGPMAGQWRDVLRLERRSSRII